MAAQVFLIAEVVRVPSTDWWRVDALDVQRGHVYATGASEMLRAVGNIHRLIDQQYFPEPVHIIGVINRAEP